MESRFREAQIQIAVVTFQAPLFARAYIEETGVRWPVLLDESRTVYEAFGMKRGRLWDVYGLPAWWAYAKEFARGRFPTWPTADTRQLGGDVLIDPDGLVRLHHVGRGPADRPSVEALLRARFGQNGP